MQNSISNSNLLYCEKFQFTFEKGHFFSAFNLLYPLQFWILCGIFFCEQPYREKLGRKNLWRPGNFKSKNAENSNLSSLCI